MESPQTEVESVITQTAKMSSLSKYFVMAAIVFVLCLAALVWFTLTSQKVSEEKEVTMPDNAVAVVSTSTVPDKSVAASTVPDAIVVKASTTPKSVPNIVITNVVTAVHSSYVYLYTDNEINYKDYNYALVDSRTKKTVPISDIVGDTGNVATAMIVTKVAATAASSWELVIYRDTTEIDRRSVTVLPDDKIPVALESVVVSSNNASSSRIATVGDTITFKATFSKPVSGISFRPNTDGENFSEKISDKSYQATLKISSSSYEGKFSFELYNIAGFSSEQVMNKNGSSITMVRETTDKSDVNIFGTGSVSPDDEEGGYIQKNEYMRLSPKDQPGYDGESSNVDIGCDVNCHAFFQRWINGYTEFNRQCGGAWEGKCVEYEKFFAACSEKYWTVDMSFLDECTATGDCDKKWRAYFTSCETNWKGDYRNYLTL